MQTIRYSGETESFLHLSKSKGFLHLSKLAPFTDLKVNAEINHFGTSVTLSIKMTSNSSGGKYQLGTLHSRTMWLVVPFLPTRKFSYATKAIEQANNDDKSLSE